MDAGDRGQDWTPEQLKHYFEELSAERARRLDERIDAIDKAVGAALDSSEKAIEKSEVATDRRLELLNEFRSQADDQAKRFATIETLDGLQRQISDIRKATDQATGRRVAWVAAAGIIMTLLAIGVGQIIRQSVTSSDISAQIQREAPWNRDKDQVERRITVLENQVQRLQIANTKLEGELRAHEIKDSQLQHGLR